MLDSDYRWKKCAVTALVSVSETSLGERDSACSSNDEATSARDRGCAETTWLIVLKWLGARDVGATGHESHFSCDQWTDHAPAVRESSLLRAKRIETGCARYRRRIRCAQQSANGVRGLNAAISTSSQRAAGGRFGPRERRGLGCTVGFMVDGWLIQGPKAARNFQAPPRRPLAVQSSERVDGI
ncbi:hypothetical protein HPB50_026630 [Hyalomma asiaticum]|uniref:Uncharacterized protein n=1 Tax=Hyalomma asiaticum TaxID=266040 RepID=A0ACB7RXX1_HYAAI|nr:hypothetical protein HPB50_026630 [Hyalomma asiaticum]